MSGYDDLELVINESIYNLPGYESSKTDEIQIEYITYRYEVKEMNKIVKSHLKLKPDKWNKDKIENLVTIQKDKFDLNSLVGVGTVHLHSIMRDSQELIEHNKSMEQDEIKKIYLNVNKELNSYIKLLNNHTRGYVDNIIWYSIDNALVYISQPSQVRDILTLGFLIKKEHPNYIKYISYI